MRQKFYLSVALIAIVLPIVAPRTLASAEPGQPAPALTVATLNGNTFDLSAQRGKVTIVNFWAA